MTNFVKEIRGIGHGIRCPRHYMLKPGANPFVMVPNPLMKNVSQANCNALSRVFKTPIRKWIKAKDKYGRPIQNFNSYIQPVISAALAREKIYQSDNPICLTCRRCLLK